jgi:hypothetical protein
LRQRKCEFLDVVGCCHAIGGSLDVVWVLSSAAIAHNLLESRQ